jgi:hypothetical protein
MGMGLTMLIALQTRYLDAYDRELSLTKAALYGQYILSFVETSSRPPDVGVTEGDLRDALRDLGYFDYEPDMPGGAEHERRWIDGWRYQQAVTSQSVPPFEDILRRVDLKLMWGDGPQEQLRLVYFASVRR